MKVTTKKKTAPRSGNGKTPENRIEEVIRGLDLPTSMAFLGKDDILVLEKDKGTVQRIVNGQIMNKSIIDVNVSTDVERCVCVELLFL